MYFAPACPHCQKVARELQALSERVAGQADVLGIASGTASQIAVDEFKVEYGVGFEILLDESYEIVAAMGARSTPSALLLRPDGDELVLVDLWYPYLPGHDSLVEMRLAVNPWSVFRPGEFHGNTTCGACHVHEVDSWQLTHHSIAWRTLALAKHDKDPKCTGCHVTGADVDDGWRSEGPTAELLVDVGCEACHGPGGPRTDARSTCEACHDEDHSIAFTVDKGMPLIDHYRAATLTPEEWQQHRRDLYDGKVPRDLLAFPDGPTAGAQACAGCHPDIHTGWATSSHARAMKTLPRASRKDPACVRCHATPRAIGGPPPTEVDAYRTDEGVGCESCHGPATAHLEAGGGRDNIEGLGDDCPVCVLEAVCTSCHTSEWDPTWHLEPHLERVRHDRDAILPP